ncbi:MAG: M56 family metallopeptidase [Candidatus Aminicenantales bacterium]
MNSFIRYLLESGVCLMLFYVIYWAVLKKETYFFLNRLYLVFSVLAALVIPLLNFPSPLISRQLMTDPGVGDISSLPQTHAVGIVDMALWIYILGAAILLIRFFVKLIQLFMVVKKYGIQKHDGLNIVFVEESCSPFSFFNNIFLNRSQLSEINFDRIIIHEKVHIHQWHSMDILIIELVTIFQWLNPFVWPYRKSLKETHEYLADNAVIAQGCSTARYQRLIFEQLVGLELFEFTNNFKQSDIKRRLTMMTKIRSNGRARLKVFLLVPAAVLLTLVFAEPRLSGEISRGERSEAALASQPDSGAPVGPALIEEQKKAEELKKEEIAAQSEEEQKKKQMEMEKEMRMLKEKEAIIREKLETVENAEDKAKLKKSLEEVLKKEAKIKSVQAGYATGQNAAEEGGIATLAKAKEKLMMLKEKELKIRTMLETVEEAEKKAELKEKLQMVLQQEAELKSLIEEIARKAEKLEEQKEKNK